jgi:hypothetical protein
MSTPRVSTSQRRPFLAPRNLLLLGAAVLSLVAGYAVLAAGHPTAGAVLLVLGYCVLFPLGIAL